MGPFLIPISVEDHSDHATNSPCGANLGSTNTINVSLHKPATGTTWNGKYKYDISS